MGCNFPMSAEILKPFGDYSTPGVDPDLVRLAEQLLAEAKAGEIIGFAVAIVRPNHMIGSLTRRGSCSTAEIAGAVAGLQYDILKNWAEY